MHLAGAIFAFVFLEAGLFALGIDQLVVRAVFSMPYSWLLVLGAFMAVGFVAWQIAPPPPARSAKQVAGT